MTDFETAFEPLKSQLDDPSARFVGEDMRDALLALVPSLPNQDATAWLYRELAVLEAKRDQLSCLDHAEKALHAHSQSNALPDDRLYFMHLICGDVATMWEGGSRTRLHLDEALRLHEMLDRPIGEALAIRRNLGVYTQGLGQDRHGLDWFEPLLRDAESHYGANNPELGNLMYLMSVSEELSGNLDRAMQFADRRLRVLEDAADQGVRVSAMVTKADLLLKSGKTGDAKRLLDDAVAFAESHCSAATQAFARDQRAQRSRTVWQRILGLFGMSR